VHVQGADRPRRGIVGDPAEALRRVAGDQQLDREEARQVIIDGLRSVHIKAVWIDPHGDRQSAVPADFTDDRIATLDFGDGLALVRESRAGEWSIVSIVQPWLEIDLLSLDQFAATVFGGAPQDRMPAEPKNRGGRPTKHDWNCAMGQILLRVRDLGIPRTQAELVNETLDWFGSHSEETPDRRAVERWIADFWPRGSRELGPLE
jgi:hypothetical protein